MKFSTSSRGGDFARPIRTLGGGSHWTKELTTQADYNGRMRLVWYFSVGGFSTLDHDGYFFFFSLCGEQYHFQNRTDILE